LTFATVNDAGFYAALDQPAAMAKILEGFLTGKALPSNYEWSPNTPNNWIGNYFKKINNIILFFPLWDFLFPWEGFLYSIPFWELYHNYTVLR